MSNCLMAGCDGRQHGRGVCKAHYMKCYRGTAAWPEWVKPKGSSVEERFWSKVDRSEDCWVWTASVLPNGYGQFDHGLAHRVSLSLIGTQIPDGYHVDHLCRNRRCVNPDHLEPVPASINTRRGYGPPVAVARMKAWSASRTHCRKGHPLTAANTYVTPSEGWRVCRTCKSASRQRKAA